jgi:uncharacterized protein (TIGR02145 family)
MKNIAKLALTAAFGLAITFTFNACDEKKKQDGTTTTATEPAAAATQEVAVEVTEVIIFTDTRDKKTYKTVKLGEQVWFAENLNFEAKGSKCYDNKPVNCQKYGRLYDWETAKKACPSDWHLPSMDEWNKLLRYADGTEGTKNPYNSETAGEILRAKSCNGSDNYDFSALLGGNGNSDGSFGNVGDLGVWWSASEYNNESVYRIEIGSNSNFTFWNYDNKGVLNSVRCIQGDAKEAEAKAKAAEEAKAAAVAALCGKGGGGGVKLLKCIAYEYGEVQKFEYDEQNRIVKIDNRTITYADNLVTVGTQKYVIKGNTVTVDGKSFTINEDGYIVEMNGAEYKYEDGNLIEISDKSEYIDEGSRYFYDDNKSPFSNSNTPKWLISLEIGINYTSGGTESLASKNNVSGYLFQGGAPGGCDSEYVYDKDEFPVKNTRTCKVDDAEYTSIIRYVYRGGN